MGEMTDISRKIDLTGAELLRQPTPSEGAPDWRMVRLDSRHMTAVRVLHSLVVDAQPEDKKNFILPRPDPYFEKFLNGDDGGNMMIGVVSGNGELIAKAVIFHPPAGAKTEDLGGAILQTPPEQTSIMQSATVHPDYRGNGIFPAMIRHWQDHARAFGKTCVHAEIEVRNEPSWRKFQEAGLAIVGTSKSPIDGASVYNAEERIKYSLMKEFKAAAADTDSEQKIPEPDAIRATARTAQDYTEKPFI